MQETPPMPPIDEISEKIWFTDEKRFIVEAPRNSQNDRVHATAQKKRDVETFRLLRGRRQFSEYVMVSLGASFDAKTSILFIERRVKINCPSYCQDVLTPMLLEIRQKMPDFVFQQDGAPAHTADFAPPQRQLPCLHRTKQLASL